jgi:hypothetical protein
MQSIQQTLRNAAVNGVISVDKAIQLAGAYDKEREESAALFKKLEKQVGMDLGERINEHLAAMNGTRFNPIDYHYEAMPADQRI